MNETKYILYHRKWIKIKICTCIYLYMPRDFGKGHKTLIVLVSWLELGEGTEQMKPRVEGDFMTKVFIYFDFETYVNIQIHF